jgi:hypothetical protein
MMPVPLGAGAIMTDSSTVVARHVVVDRAVLQRHLDHVAAGFFHGLLHGSGHFLGFALAHANAAIAVAYHGQCSETEDTAALDHFGDAVDRDHLFAQAVFRDLHLALSLNFSHSVFRVRLELQAGFTRSISQRLDAAVVRKTCAIKCHLLDACSLGLFSDTLANDLGCSGLPPLPEPPSDLRTSASAVEALASTLLPSPEITLA